jgi:hypothetical protein
VQPILSNGLVYAPVRDCSEALITQASVFPKGSTMTMFDSMTMPFAGGARAFQLSVHTPTIHQLNPQPLLAQRNAYSNGPPQWNAYSARQARGLVNALACVARSNCLLRGRSERRGPFVRPPALPPTEPGFSFAAHSPNNVRCSEAPEGQILMKKPHLNVVGQPS